MDSVDVRSQVLRTTLDEISANRDDTTDDENCCVICLENVTELATAEPCKHQSFDFLCLLSWLEESPTCPLCKADVKAVRYDYREGELFKTYIVPSAPAANPSATSNASTRRIFASRPRRPYARRQYNTRPPTTPNDALLRRRHIYRNQLYSLHVGSNRMSQYQELTSCFIPEWHTTWLESQEMDKKGAWGL
ncbi:hypothetical protein G7Y89_g7541 [Cudoniella acicularis]|uniref:RING-type E3 ubiquitin transferase n=1 Tax=Cudoniella acicularis TaxID=354080 RepID=A0A8H4W3Q1_9HELO|nr:hypothetical protein G7Y89_g7541 [Cudoniella acicularis]